jgi:hypothetical protein
MRSELYFSSFLENSNLHGNLYFAKNGEKVSCIFHMKITILVLGLSEFHCIFVSEKAVRSHAYI